MPSDRPTVTNSDDFERVIFELLDDNDAIVWKNDTAYQFLQAMVAWLRDSPGFYKGIGENRDTSEASWQLFADMLQAATCYE